MIRSGQLRNEVIIQRATLTVDAYGASVSAWAEQARAWAGISYTSGREVYADLAKGEEQPVTVLMRWQPSLSDVTVGDRVLVVADGTVLDIKGVMNVSERDRVIRLVCVRGRSD